MHNCDYCREQADHSRQPAQAQTTYGKARVLELTTAREQAADKA
jgi:hypothetical protein